ncbi:MAG: transposase [Chloroflexi bacterium]|nr:transposase [Chloroflexota bacterium]
MVTATRDREPIFGDPGCASILVKAIQFVRLKKANVLAYAIMPDHLHALFVPREGHVISQVMQSVKGFTARLGNEKLDRRGPLCQRSFYDRMIRDEEHLLEVVEEKPVEFRSRYAARLASLAYGRVDHLPFFSHHASISARCSR